MERNRLASLSLEHLPQMQNLKTLYFDVNNLTEFDFERVKDKYPQLQNIHFGHNQFECCFLVDMVNAMLLQMPRLSGPRIEEE
jgi:hypothetical protein